MRFKIDHDYHIHSCISACAAPYGLTKDGIFAYAKENKLKKICITDHYWDSDVKCSLDWYLPQNFEHISQIKPLPQDSETEFLFDCETDMDKHFTIGVPNHRLDDFSFIIIPG